MAMTAKLKLVLLLLRAEPELVDQFQRVAERIAAAELAFDLAEDFADLVVDGVRAGGALLEAAKVREQLVIDEGSQVIAGQGNVMVEAAVVVFRRRPDGPLELALDDRVVGLAPVITAGWQGGPVLNRVQPVRPAFTSRKRTGRAQRTLQRHGAESGTMQPGARRPPRGAPSALGGVGRNP